MGEMNLPARSAFWLRAGSLLGISGALTLACVGDDPTVTAPSASADGGSDSATPLTDASASDTGVVDEPSTTGACPDPAPAAVPCGPTLVSIGNPALHLDACSLPMQNARIADWASPDGKITMKGAPGALLCQTSFNGRPAVHFDRDGFTLAAGNAVALDTSPEHYLAIVMQYAPGARARSAAGGVVFERTAASYPFFGPKLAANFAYQAQVGAPTSFEPTQLVGGAFRFGVKSRSVTESTFAAVADRTYPEPMLVVYRRLGARISLSINGVEVGFDDRPDGDMLSDGTGNPVSLGRGASENAYFLGKIAEVLFYKSTPQSTADLENELKARWGIK